MTECAPLLEEELELGLEQELLEEPQLGEEVGPPQLLVGLELELEQVVVGGQQLPALAVVQAGGEEEEEEEERSTSSHQ